MPAQRPHLILPVAGPRFEFSMRGSGGTSNHPPAVIGRAANGRRVLRELGAVIATARAAADVDEARIPLSVRAGTPWGVARSLPGRRNDVLSSIGFGRRARINVALDAETLESFESAAGRYAAWSEGDERKPSHFNFFEARPTLGFTAVEDLWMAVQPLPDADEEFRWEVWMPRSAEPRFRERLEELGLPAPRRSIRFGNLHVLSLEATRADLDQLARSGTISQLRPASSLAGELVNMTDDIQRTAVRAAPRRVVPADAEAPAVCLLDTGLRRDHPLLEGSVDFTGSVSRGPGPDWSGHGTKMAGLVLFDDLPGLVLDGGSAHPSVRLESVVVQPPSGVLEDRLPAERLRAAVGLVEDEADRPRTFCFAMSAPEEGEDGGVASLSSELDRLASDVGTERLFCVPAGNLDHGRLFTDYQTLNETTGLTTPAQAWNALTVAACTDLGRVPSTHGPLAPPGDLSPWSRTAVNWERGHRPPMKPDVVYEGGNRMYDLASSDVANHADLCLMTTSSDPAAPLALTAQTSAATAAMAGLCGRLQAEYPGLWPETIRGLVAHSCEYSPAMLDRARSAASTRRSLEAALIERFGYGRPDAARAMENAEDSLTFITQGALLPLRPNDAENGVVLGYMRRHDPPWPEEVLEELDVEAELRITLSYFVEPNPGAVLKGVYDLYASHGFDFDVKRPDESHEQAVARINGSRPAATRSNAPPLPWTFGSKERGGPMRNMRRGGCLKHDRATMPARDLARVGSVMVFPRKGWWGGDPERVEQQARYSLIVSIRTPEEEIYTEIANAIEV